MVESYWEKRFCEKCNKITTHRLCKGIGEGNPSKDDPEAKWICWACVSYHPEERQGTKSPKKGGLKIIKKDYREDWAKNEDLIGETPELLYKIYDFDKPQYFETLIRQKGATTFSEDHPIDSITIEGESGFSWATFHFGNFGHIHIGLKELEKLKEGINWIYDELKKEDDETIEIEENEDGTFKYKKQKDKEWTQGNPFYPEEDN